ncbi:MAG: tripartite tricarboxylate transporter TctB family protein [Ruminococcaceae bacterium]|nr:tripartite tricarboxylate transporter TctB family protein [Oscillospiraceae bacterium]
MNKTQRQFELCVLVILTVVCSFSLYTAFTAESKFAVEGLTSMDFPKAVFGIIVFFCLCLMVPNVKALIVFHKQSSNAEKIMDWRIPGTMLLIIVYGLSWKLLGFFLSSFLYFTFQARLLDKSTGIIKNAAISFSLVAFVYLVFGLLFRVDFPEPLLEMILG